ncbi:MULTISPECIES: ABC transporter permease [Flavobacterium]|uniref:ABC transporter permease n=1 Tax=Flavobacterium TaxID=237 RepID=UPI001FCB85FC|nr:MULTISPECIES: ABC transporter permease [Flavobacterium]UOK41997.1 ABC transporter permease [Flavobacterium enshiense]
MIRFLLEKEFKQIIRNSFLPRMILLFPVMVLLVFPMAANFEIKNINLCIIDNDHSSYSNQLVQKIISSGYFRLTSITTDPKKALDAIEKDKSDIILEIPSNFEKNLVREQTARLLISANSVNGTKGGLGSAYLSGIITDFSSEIREKWIQPTVISGVPIMEIVNQNRFNTHLSYKIFMVPALMVMLLTMLCGFLPALNIVGEKEAGTMEQINVTPIPKFIFILSKLLPYWIIGFVVITIAFAVAYIVYGLSPAGSLGTIYVFAAIYILGVSGLGLVISNYSNTMQQAMFVMYFFMLILILMSGLFTPVQSMPEWAQLITTFNPLKYFMQVMRMVYLKGSGFSDLGTQFFALSCFALFFNLWAVLNYRKTL